MLYQFIVYATNGVFCIEDDSIIGAIESALLESAYPEYERVYRVIQVNIIGYPY